MNELIGTLLFAAIFSAGDGLLQREGKADEDEQAGRAQVAHVSRTSYRSVEAKGEVRRGERVPAR